MSHNDGPACSRRRFGALTLGLGVGVGLGSAGKTGQVSASTDSEGTEADYYVSPDGDDANAGAASEPFETIQYAIEQVSAGERIRIEAGTYTPDESIDAYRIDGEPDAPIVLEGDPEGDIVVEGARLRLLQSAYWEIRDMIVRNSDTHGVVITEPESHDVVVEGVEAYDNENNGFLVSEEAHDVTIRNCSSHDNAGSDGEETHADGFNVALNAARVTFEDCEAYRNLDDGWDLNNAASGHVIEDCKAWENGYDGDGDLRGNGRGFKLGAGKDVSESSDPVVVRCAAWDNRVGFGWNDAGVRLRVVNCTGVSNVQKNVRFGDDDHTHVLRNVVSYTPDPGGDWKGDEIADGVRDEYNTWNLDIDDPGFRSTDPSDEEFLELESDSPCIDAGTADTTVPIEYTNEAPDLGANESIGTE